MNERMNDLDMKGNLECLYLTSFIVHIDEIEAHSCYVTWSHREN